MTRTSRFLLSVRFGMKKRGAQPKAPPGARAEDDAGRSIVGAIGSALLKKRTIPSEVLGIILQEAWLSFPLFAPSSRWQFFRAVRAVCRQWRDAMLRVATRCIPICLRSNEDLAGYLAVGRLALQEAQFGVPEAIGETLELEGATDERGYNMPSTSTAILDPHQLARVFRHAAAYLHVAYGCELSLRTVKTFFSEQEILQLDCGGEDLRYEWTSKSTRFLSLLRSVIPDCKKVYITSRMIAFHYEEVVALLNFVAAMPSATALEIDARIEFYSTRDTPHTPSAATPQDLSPPIPMLPNVRSLRLHEYPRCSCKDHELGNGHAKGTCFTFELMSAFPNAEHLRIDTPLALRNITPPSALRTLTLQVPPLASGAAPYSVVGYNIPSAVKHGLFSAHSSGERQPRIVCRAGESEPTGWAQAQAACAQCGIELVREIA
ncbi:hypothetical protein BD414DRAFT_497905 [Trametes punicea]|nr:hypothetical protein BD414DRAFT_497905 [Trametes punicea]